jgi:serine/threonine-protein kinase
MRGRGKGERARGEVIAGRYRLDRVLGEGGMGTVYRATHLTLHTPVAIKLMHAAYSAQEKYRRRFTREARVTSLLKHPNAVQVLDFGEHEDSLYLVMEYLTGRPLRQQIRRSSLPSVEKILEYGIQLADALKAAHDLKLVHRDLKPDNIMIEERPDGGERLVVVDFGLAFMEATPEELGRLTTVGLISGTPQYMAPEQARGLEVTPAADVYAMGCLLYELATGAAPFNARSAMDILHQHLFTTPTSPRELAPQRALPAALEGIILDCLQKTPEDRPLAAEVKRRLEALRDGDHAEDEAQRGARALQARTDRANPTRVPTATARPVQYVAAQEGLAATLAVLSWPESHPLFIALRANGYQCLTATSGALPDEADLILAPRPTLDEARALCAAAAGRPVLITSHAGDIDLATEFLRAGVAEIIVEPVRTEELLRKTDRTLRKLRRTRA